MIDPLAIDPLARFDVDPLARLMGGRGRRPSALPPLTPEEENNLLSQTLGYGVGALGAVGHALDTPGAYLRGALGGEAGSRLSGRDMLENWGVLDENRPGFDAGDVAGFAADLVFDPLSFLGFGMATKAGTTALKAGTAAKGLGKGIAAGERSLLSVGLPFTDNALHFGTSQKVGDALTGIGEAVRGAPVIDPLYRAGRMLFDPSVQGTFKKTDQLGAALGYESRKRGRPQGELEFLKWAGETEPVFDEFHALNVKHAPAPQTQVGDLRVGDIVDVAGAKGYGRVTGFDQNGFPEIAFRSDTGRANMVSDPANVSVRYRGGTPQADDFAKYDGRNLFFRVMRLAAETNDFPGALAQVAPHLAQNVTPQLLQKMQGRATAFFDLKNTGWDEYTDLGGAGGMLEEWANFAHVMRYADGAAMERAGVSSRGNRFVDAKAKSATGRSEAIRTLPTELVNEALKDSAVRGPDGADVILQKYGHLLPQGGSKTPDQMAEELHQFVLDHGDGFSKSGTDLFGNRFDVDFHKYQADVRERAEVAKSIHGLFGDSVKPGGVPLADAAKAANLDPQRFIDRFARDRGISPADAAQLTIDPQAVEAAKATWRMWEEPEWSKQVGGFVDRFHRILKDNLLLPFPSYHARNLAGGLYVTMASGLLKTPQDLRHLIDATSKAYKLPQADDYLHEMQAHELLGSGSLFEDASRLRPAGQGVKPGNLFSVDDTMEAARESIEREAPLFGTERPLLDRTKATRTARLYGKAGLAYGAKVAENIEYGLKGGLYVYLRERGWNPKAAADKVKELQFDYSKGSNTPFERTVAKRLVPFYSFQRQVMPLTFRTLAQKPGGLMGQSVQAASAPGEDGTFVPSWLREGVSVPLGEGRYLSKLGLPFEDPLGRLVIEPTAMGSIGRTIEKNVGSMSPLVTLPYALASGKESFSGRPLEDLYQSPTSDPLTNLLISKSPASRYATEYRQAIDPRKGWGDWAFNFFTGADVTDVSPSLDAIKLKEANDALSKLAAENPEIMEYRDFYVPRGKEVSPETRDLEEQFRRLDRLRKTQVAKRAQEEARESRSLAGKLGG